MLLERATLVGLAGLLVLGSVTLGSPAGEKMPGDLKRMDKPGNYEAFVGDLLVISMQSNPSTGPDNPAANLRVKVKGDAAKAVTVVFAPPAKPKPGASGRVQAYLVAEKVGAATIEVTPIKGNGQPGEAKEYKVTVSERK